MNLAFFEDHKENRALLHINGKAGMIDRDGNEVVSPKKESFE